jgi:hypothetical protein
MTRNINHEAVVSIPWGIFQRLESVASITGESAETITLRALEQYLAEKSPHDISGPQPRNFSADELEASYQSMAADEERESEAREWCGSHLGEDLAN